MHQEKISDLLSNLNQPQYAQLFFTDREKKVRLLGFIEGNLTRVIEAVRLMVALIARNATTSLEVFASPLDYAKPGLISRASWWVNYYSQQPTSIASEKDASQ
ncbi:hypothetical protein [Pseudomonas sp. KK4]|uniref:hypothetical protein n=1 Tax=Pseudomonas sp. KK4 TaxID=1855729 RepID=UPI00097C2CDA|nr:hypothetical protein [Pseudomonas sp. KK4]